MNCSEFRRRLLEDPACNAADFLDHRANCDVCDAEAREVERLDDSLRELMRVTPPRDLERRLRAQPAKRRWIPVAAAASLAGLLAVSVILWQPWAGGGSDRRLADEVMEHVLHEPRALVAHEPVPLEGWREASPTVRLDPEGFRHVQVTYAMPCELSGRPGLHLVMASDTGPVTLLVVVDVVVAEPRLLSREGFRGVVRPIRHGSLAVIGSLEAPVEALARDLSPFIEIRG